MSKGNLFLGKARGRVGSVVFSTLRGEQITRAYQSQVRNPKSDAQAAQRAIFATATVASAMIPDIVDHSFDGLKHGAENRNEFIRVNVNRMRSVYVDGGAARINAYLIPKGAKNFKPGNWILSRGSLGEYVPEDTKVVLKGSDASMTYDDVKNDWFWLENGAQVTFIAIQWYTDSNNKVVYRTKKARLVFNNLVQNADVEIFQYVDTTHYGFVSTYLDLTRCEGVVFMDDPVSGVQFVAPEFLVADNDKGLHYNTQDGYVCHGIIGTQYNPSRTDPYVHTTSSMIVDTDAWDDTDDNIATYGSAAKVYKPSDYYLDQAVINETGGSGDATLEELVSGYVAADGMQSKSIYLGKTNSYGPVAEGAPINFVLSVPQSYNIAAGTTTIYNGETQVTEQFKIYRTTDGLEVTIRGTMPTTASFQANISFDVYVKTTGERIGRAAIRVLISKAN